MWIKSLPCVCEHLFCTCSKLILLKQHSGYDRGTEICCGLDISMGTSGRGGREDPVGAAQGACVRFPDFLLHLNCLCLSNSHRCVQVLTRENLCLLRLHLRPSCSGQPCGLLIASEYKVRELRLVDAMTQFRLSVCLISKHNAASEISFFFCFFRAS